MLYLVISSFGSSRIFREKSKSTLVDRLMTSINIAVTHIVKNKLAENIEERASSDVHSRIPQG